MIAADWQNVVADCSNLAADRTTIGAEWADVGVDRTNLGVDCPEIGVDWTNIAVDRTNIAVGGAKADADRALPAADLPRRASPARRGADFHFDTLLSQSKNRPLRARVNFLDTPNTDERSSSCRRPEQSERDSSRKANR